MEFRLVGSNFVTPVMEGQILTDGSVQYRDRTVPVPAVGYYTTHTFHPVLITIIGQGRKFAMHTHICKYSPSKKNKYFKPRFAMFPSVNHTTT